MNKTLEFSYFTCIEVHAEFSDQLLTRIIYTAKVHHLSLNCNFVHLMRPFAKVKSLSFMVNDISKRLEVTCNAHAYLIRLDLYVIPVFNFLILFTHDEYDCRATENFLTLILFACQPSFNSSKLV